MVCVSKLELFIYLSMYFYFFNTGDAYMCDYETTCILDSMTEWWLVIIKLVLKPFFQGDFFQLKCMLPTSDTGLIHFCDQLESLKMPDFNANVLFLFVFLFIFPCCTEIVQIWTAFISLHLPIAWSWITLCQFVPSCPSQLIQPQYYICLIQVSQHASFHFSKILSDVYVLFILIIVPAFCF